MALNITTLATRWGHQIAGVNEAATFAGTTATTRADSIFGDFASFAAQRDVVDDLYQAAIGVESDVSSYFAFLTGLIPATLQAMCRDDSQRPKSDDLDSWMEKLNRDMATSSDSFTSPTVSTSITNGSGNVGDGTMVVSTVEPLDGKATYFAHTEHLRAIVTSDSYTGSATAGAEAVTITGETSVPTTSAIWPKGSGASLSTTPTTPATDGILTDGGLENWTGNTPNSWTAIGTPGTNITKGTSSPYNGSAYCVFTGDGSSTVGLYQDLTAKLVANTNYAFAFWLKLPSGTLGTGSPTSLRIALVDGTGTVINNNAGTAQSTSIGASTLNTYTSWTRTTVSFQTPRTMPSGVRLEFKFITNPLDNSKSVFLDNAIAAEMEAAYAGGPYVAMFGGAVPFAINDAVDGSITNNKGVTNFVRALDRALDLKGNGIRLTVAASGSQSDSLIT